METHPTHITWAADLEDPDWEKASFSNGNGGSNCVEVAYLDAGTAVRDSKNPDGPALVFTPSEWDAFLAGARNGEFDRPAST